MTTEGKQQEAVCGTCGASVYQSDDGRWWHRQTLSEAVRYGLFDHGAIPAPVVPSDDHEHLHRHVDAVATCREVESAIRAPYEELVKAARALRDAELRLISTPYEMRQSWDEANDARARAYVVLDNAFREHDAHIEESLGGRKDG